jgi:hypothetical protein
MISSLADGFERNGNPDRAAAAPARSERLRRGFARPSHGWRCRRAGLSQAMPHRLEATLHRSEAIPHRLEATLHRSEGIPHRLEAIPYRLKAIAHRLEVITHRLQAMQRQRGTAREHGGTVSRGTGFAALRGNPPRSTCPRTAGDRAALLPATYFENTPHCRTPDGRAPAGRRALEGRRANVGPNVMVAAHSDRVGRTSMRCFGSSTVQSILRAQARVC